MRMGDYTMQDIRGKRYEWPYPALDHACCNARYKAPTVAIVAQLLGGNQPLPDCIYETCSHKGVSCLVR